MNRFEEALNWFNRANWDERVPCIHAIRYALKLAAKLEQEPSEGMLIAGRYANVGPRSSVHGYIWEAMLEQAKREIE